MSDFGSHVAVYRVDGRDPPEEDVRKVQVAARSLQFARTDRIGPYDEFELRFGGSQSADGINGLSVFLSGYFVEDDNDGLDPDVLIAREAPIAEQFANDLERVLGAEYRAEGYSGQW